MSAFPSRRINAHDESLSERELAKFSGTGGWDSISLEWIVFELKRRLLDETENEI